MNGPAPHQQILDLLRAIPAVDCQNRLMKLADRELSLSLLYMSDAERDRVLALVGTGKGRRVRQELDRLERSRLDYRQYEMAASVVVRTLQGSGTTAPRSYYRPSRTRRTR